jgi:magnesium-transporting ATPase (P-type)
VNNTPDTTTVHAVSAPGDRSGDASGDWHVMTAETALQRLDVVAHAGLSADDASGRLLRDGPNAITARQARPWWVRLAMQFAAPLVYILLAAGAVTLALGEYVDAAVIFGVVLVNALVGFAQETRAVRAIDALARSMRVEATVRRDGVRRRIDASLLVRGDIVLLEPGDKVPADLRLVALRDLRCDESTLTGESKSVAKRPESLPETTVLADRKNMAYAGTLVSQGAGEGVVVATGDATEVGRINELISSAQQIETPLTRKIAAFTRLLIWVILAVAVLAFAVGVARGDAPTAMFKAAVALAVGAIPEGLPAAVTIMLAVGVSRMARRRAIIRKLPAVEALGSTTVICSDKTGTLTQNQMTVRAAWLPASPGGAPRMLRVTGEGYDGAGSALTDDDAAVSAANDPAAGELFVAGMLCNDAALALKEGRWEVTGDPTEAALLVSGQKVGLSRDTLAESRPRVDAIPFESDRQYMATLHASTPRSADGAPPETGTTVYVKGSVERVLAMCRHAAGPDGRTTPLDIPAVHEAVGQMARQALRVLAFARLDVPGGVEDLTHAMVEQSPEGLTFLGLQGMLDPPRPEAIAAVAACRRAGVAVKMITGDHAITAATIAGMIGIAAADDDPASPRVLTGAEMAALSDEQLPDQTERTAVFARMTPEQKLRLVRALQGRGHVVAMTGDGVNDAPALRQADIGVAMGVAGTEVAKDAADMILADDNFASVEAAVEEGRSVFANLTKFIVWTLPTNVGEAMVILAAIGFGWTLPILPVHALYINMVTAVLLGMPLIFEQKEPGIMARPPRDPRRPLLTFELFMRTGLVSVLLCIGATGLFQWELSNGASLATARTAAVSVIVVGEVFYLFAARSLLRPAWSVPLFSNGWLWVGIACMLAVQWAFAHLSIANLLFHSAALDAGGWARVMAAGAAVLVVVEMEKTLRRAMRRRWPASADEG